MLPSSGSRKKPLQKPPSLEYAKLIPHRRACRVAGNRQMEENNYHSFNMQQSVASINAHNETQRLTHDFRLGNVPAHIAHPIVAGLLRPAPAAVPAAVPAAAPDVDMGDANERAALAAEVAQGGIGVALVGINPVLASFYLTKARDAGVPNMELFTKQEQLVGRSAVNRRLYSDAIRTRNIKQIARNAKAVRQNRITRNNKIARATASRNRRV